MSQHDISKCDHHIRALINATIRLVVGVRKKGIKDPRAECEYYEGIEHDAVDEALDALQEMGALKNEHRPEFRNFYECGRCGEKWEDVWTATCDDDCPKCGLTMTPYKSEDEN